MLPPGQEGEGGGPDLVKWVYHPDFGDAALLALQRFGISFSFCSMLLLCTRPGAGDAAAGSGPGGGRWGPQHVNLRIVGEPGKAEVEVHARSTKPETRRPSLLPGTVVETSNRNAEP
jgi:hypothetical protein